MSDAPMQTYAQREALRRHQEAQAPDQRATAPATPSLAFEIALVAVVAIILVAFIPLIRSLPKPPAPLASCPPLEPGLVVVVTLYADAKGALQATCAAARGRTKAAP